MNILLDRFGCIDLRTWLSRNKLWIYYELYIGIHKKLPWYLIIYKCIKLIFWLQKQGLKSNGNHKPCLLPVKLYQSTNLNSRERSYSRIIALNIILLIFLNHVCHIQILIMIQPICFKDLFIYVLLVL
jgi:hypothetical protein